MMATGKSLVTPETCLESGSCLGRGLLSQSGSRASLKVLAYCGAMLVLAGWEPFRSPNRNVEEGRREFRDGLYHASVESFRRAVGELSGDPASRFNLGVALSQLARSMPANAHSKRDALLAEAENELRQSLAREKSPLEAKAHYNLGNVLFLEGRFRDASLEYRKALAIDPSEQSARYNLELALRKQHEEGAARTPADKRSDGSPPASPGSGAPSAANAGNETDQKLDALERRSRSVRAERERARAYDGHRGRTVEDW